MNIRSLCFASAVVSVAVSGCKDRHDPPIADPGGGQTVDAPASRDGAHVYEDAAIARACVNKSAPVPFNGHENLELAITCRDLSETGTITHVMLHGVMSSNDAGTVIDTTTMFTVDCGMAYGAPANNFIDLTTNDTLTATSISATPFDVPCN
jgi:hypothetical protein